MNNYLTLKNRQSKEVDNFPIFWAFSNKQFEEGMKSFNLAIEGTDQICRVPGGGFCRKTRAKELGKLFLRHEIEISEARAADKTGEGYIFDMFDYELSNHEYSYTGVLEDTLDALGLSMEDIEKNDALSTGLKNAIISQRSEG